MSGIDYQPIAPTVGGYRIAGAGSSGGAYTSDTKSFQDNLATIRKQQEEYAAQQKAADEAAQQRESGGGAPFWMKGLDLVGKAMKYTTGNTYARKYIPGVSAAEDYIPGVKTALDVATNPLTYVPIAGEAGLATRLGLGLAAAAGGGAGEYLGEKYAETGAPGGKFAPLIGGLLGGIGTYQGGVSTLEHGIGGIPALGRAVPGDLKEFGKNEAFAASIEAKKVSAQAFKESKDALEAGHPLPGHTVYEIAPDIYTYRMPTPVHNTLDKSLDDLGSTEALLQDTANNGLTNHAIGTVNQQGLMQIMGANGLDAQQAFHPAIDQLRPGEIPIRINARYVQPNPETGLLQQTSKVSLGDIEVYIAGNGKTGWQPLTGFLGDEKHVPTKLIVPNEVEGEKFTALGDGNWIYNKTPEEVAAQRTASALAAYGVDTETGARIRSGEVVNTPPPEPGQQAMPLAGDMGATREPLATPPAPSPAVPPAAAPPPEGYQPPMLGLDKFAVKQQPVEPVAPEGMRLLNPKGRAARSAERRTPIFQDRSHPRVKQIIADTLDPNVEGGGGSSTNIMGEPMKPGYGLSINPERTQVIPAEQFNASPETALAMYYAKNKDLLSDPNYYLGTWRSPTTGNISLDVSINPTDSTRAQTLMEHFNQEAMAKINPDGTVEIIPNGKYDPTRGLGAVAAGTANEVAEAAPRVANPEVKAMADDYNAKAGLTPLPKETPYLETDPAFMKKIADAYETMPVDTPEVKAAYEAFGKEIHAQFLDAQAKGITFTPETNTSITEIYPTAQAMRDDVANNKHLLVNTGGTTQGELEKVMPDTGWTLNNEFRAIHDLYGHAKEGMDFGPRGEFNASFQHSLMFSPEAQKAMLSETLGQTAWGNFHSPGVRAGTEPFVFAEQRAGILPEEVRNEFYAKFGGQPQAVPGAELPTQRMTLTHYGPKQLSEINPEFQGTGVPSEELKRVGPNPNASARFASYYEEGAKPEKFFTDKTGAQRPSQFKHTVTGDFKVIDLNSPEGQAFRQQAGVPVGQELDNALQKAGYDGYKVGDQGTVRMFGVRPVSAVNDIPTVREIPSENSVMKVASDGSAVDEAFAGPRKSKSTVAEDVASGKFAQESAPPVGQIERRRVVRTPLDEVVAAKAERRSITDAEDARRFEQNAGLRKSMEELAIDKGEMAPGAANPKGRELTYGGQEGEKVYTLDIGDRTAPRSVTYEYRLNPDGTAEYHKVIYRNGSQWQNEPWKAIKNTDGLEERLKGQGYTAETEAAVTSDPALQKVVDGEYARLDAMDSMNIKAARASVKKLEAAGIDTTDANSALDDLEAVATGSTKEERDDAWDTFKNAVNDSTVPEKAAGPAPGEDLLTADTARPMASAKYGDRGAAAEDAGRKLLRTLNENPKGRMPTHGMLYGKGAVNEAGNFLPEAVKQLYADGKILNGSKGTRSVQDILGKMAAADFLLHGEMDDAAWQKFGQMAQEQFGIDLKAAATGTGVQKGLGETLEDYVRLRAGHYVNSMLSKPKYNGDLSNMQRLTGLLLSADPQAGRWYEGTLPPVYELFGEPDGNIFLKFAAVTSQQKSPRDNIQLALDAFADYKLGYFKDPEYKVYGVPGDVMDRLRYVAEGGEPTGMKISAFHGSMTLDDFNAPVDRWMFRIFGFDDTKVASDSNVHEIIAQQMRLMADELGMTPREVQARLWVAARNESEGANVVNEPFEELMLGHGKYSDSGQLLPDHGDTTGLPTAKQTLQHILDMRDNGTINLPHDTTAAQEKAAELIAETQKFRQGKAEVSMQQAQALAKDAGVEVQAGEEPAAILDRVFAAKGQEARGPVFTPADAAYDAELKDIKQMSFAGMEQNPGEVMDYNPTAMAARHGELNDWHAAGAIDHPTLPQDLGDLRDRFRAEAAQMTPGEAAKRLHSDLRTPEWQKAVIRDVRPEVGEGAVAEEARARPFGRPAQTTGESATTGVPSNETLDVLKNDLRKAGVPEERIDEIAQNAMGAAQSPEQATEAGQAIRGASRAEALAPSPYGQEAQFTKAAESAPKVNGRPVVSLEDGAATGTAAGDAIQKTIAESAWAPVVDQQLSDSVDFAVNILERTPYRVGGAGPRAGGLYYKRGEIGFYNEVKQTGPMQADLVPRSEASIVLNPVDLYTQAKETARLNGQPLHEALADETLETALHETAHDLAYHLHGGSVNDQPGDTFLNVLNAMKEQGAADIEAQRTRVRAAFKQMDADGTLVKWENDNARIRRTAFNSRTERNPVGINAQGNAEGVPLQAAARGTRGEGVPASVAGRGGEPGAGVSDVGGAAESRLAASAGLPERSPTARVERVGLNGERTDTGAAAKSRTSTAPGAQGQPNVTAIKVPAPQLLEKAGDAKATKVFETPVPTGERISAAPRTMDEVSQDIFKDNNFRRAAERLARTNPLLKRVLTTVGGKAATAVSDLEKDIAIYAVKTDVDKSRIVGMMAELRQAKRPFDKLAGNLTNMVDWRGNKVVVPLGDVLSFPKNFELSAAQQGYVDRYHTIIDELVGDARKQGIDIKELGLTKVEGGHYVPRWVQGADGVEIEARYAKGGLGTKQRFEKVRAYDTEADGMAAGIQYHDSEQALQNFAESIMKRTRDKEIIDRVRGQGRTPAELLGPGPRSALDAQVMKLKDARRTLSAAQKTVDDLTGKNIAVQAGRKTLSPADIRSMVADHPDVKAARQALDEVTKRRDVLTKELAAAKSAEKQGTLQVQLDAIKGKVLDGQEALAQARKDVRAHVSGTDQAAVSGVKATSKAGLKAARADLAKAQAAYDNVFAGTKQERTVYRSMLNTKAGTFRESGMHFGMGGDIIPVRQTRELPGLQGRVFPSEVMDVLEKGLGDKGNQALTKIASVNDLARMFTTSTDFGATMLQGLPVLAYNPKAWARATIKSIHAFFDPQALQRYYATNRTVANEASNYIGGLSTNEFFHSAVGGESVIGKAAKSSIPLLNKPAQAVERFGVSFDTFLDVAKLEMWKSLSPMAKGDTGKLEELGRFIRNLSGTTSTARLGASTTQRQVESLLMFSPRFTRSVFAMAGQALERGAGGDQARKALGGLVFGAMALYAGTKIALNKAGVTDEPFSWKDFDPTQGGRFMSIKVGDNYIGLGGSMRGAIQLLGTGAAAAVTDPSKFLSTDTTSKDANPFLKYLRGRSSPLAGEGWNVLTGKDAIGQEYDGRSAWLAKLPDAFVPFAVQSIVETEGGPAQKFGVFGAQTMGLRTFPETKNENLTTAFKDVLKKMPTDLPGFSQAERDDVSNWADLTKYQKSILLQRAPELRSQLDPKEAQFWTGYKQVQADSDAAKRALGQQLLNTMEKQASGTALTATDITPEQYRSAIADVATKTRAAEAALNGANAITGLGGDFTASGGPRTHRQSVLDAYYKAVDSVNFVDPTTGQVDFNKKDELASKYLDSIPAGDRDIISQEQGAEYDSMARELKVAKLALAPYWNIGDGIAQTMGFQNAEDLAVGGTAYQQKRYATARSDAQERFRRTHPEVDSLLVQWGYVSKGINDQSTGTGSSTLKMPKLVKTVRTKL